MEHQVEVNNNKVCKDTIPSVERNALWNLLQRTDIVIKLADKGSAVVMLSISKKLTNN